jgi:hypothetical protein
VGRELGGGAQLVPLGRCEVLEGGGKTADPEGPESGDKINELGTGAISGSVEKPIPLPLSWLSWRTSHADLAGAD